MLHFDRGDPRLFVPKRHGVGYTLNFGHRHAPWLGVGVALVPVVIVAALLLTRLPSCHGR